MYGQQSSTPFGSPPATNPTGFGAQTNTTPAFGGGSTFGASTATPTAGGFGGFGTPAPAPSGFGGFGSTAPAPGGFGATPGGFGSPPAAAPTGGFGTTTTSTPFSAPAPSGGLFGGGAPAPAPGGLFGGGATTTGGFGTAPAPAPGGFGGFGSTANTSSAFGAPAPGAFGAPAPAPGLFGATAPAQSAFGATPATTPAFGAPAPSPGGLFGGGAPAPAPPTGLFGSPAAGATGGTKGAPYQVTNRVDGASNMSLQAITAMSQYENKSFEELRFEDYSMGNKGDGSGGSTGGFGFGAPAPAPGGLFGSSAAAPAPGAFGSTGGFGTPAPAPGAFGAAAPSAFGATPAPAPGGFGFGSTSAAPAPGAFGGFGSTAAKAPAPLFGATTAPAPGGLFGGSPAAPAPAPGALFGAPAPAPGGLFGSTPAPAPSLFGAPVPAPTGLFGAAPAPGAFGATTQPAPPPSTGLFGAAAPAPTGLFGASAPAPGGGFFGAPAPAPGASLFGAAKPPGTSLFGAPAPSTGLFSSAGAAPASTGMFGPTQAAAPPPYAITSGGVPASSIMPPTADAILAQQLAAVENQKKELKKLDVWRGGAPKEASVVPLSLSERESRMSSYSPATTGLTPYRASPKSSTQIRPRGFGPNRLASPSLSLGTPGKSSPIMSPGAYVESSVKRLVIKPDSLTPKPGQRLLLKNTPYDGTERLSGHVESPLVNGRSPPVREQTPRAALPPPSQDETIDLTNQASDSSDLAVRRSPDAQGKSPSASGKTAVTPTAGYGYDFYKRVVSPPNQKGAPKAQAAERSEPPEFAPKLTKPGYTTTPTLAELSSMSEADLAAVSGFSIERDGFGSVEWEGAVDVRGVDLDSVVSIEERDVAVYDNEESNGTKPQVGSKLNRPAAITMFKVFPKHGPTKEAAVNEKMKAKVTKQTTKMGAELISYDPETGVWKFRVSHFSRYGLVDDSDDEDEMDVVGKSNGAKPSEGHFESGERGGRSPERTDAGEEVSTELAVVDSDTQGKNEYDALALVSDAESSDAQALQAAEDAYAMFSQMEVSDIADGVGKPLADEAMDEEEDFPDEGWAEKDTGDEKRSPPLRETPFTASNTGIVAKLARKVGLKSETASSTDYGIRMGRSFRVGWRPDGSFVQLRPVSKDGNRVGMLVMKRPLFSDKESGGVKSTDLETHLHHSSKDTTSIKGCPFFSIPKTRYALGGTLSSHVSWCGALSSYTHSSGVTHANVVDAEQAQVVTRAFSLLMSLYGVEKAAIGEVPNETDMSSLPRRRFDAFGNWLKAACAADVERDMREKMNDTHSVIFAALTGGDIGRASQIAMANGYYHLSAILTSGMFEKDDVIDQVQRWHESGAALHIPPSLLRIYTLLGGDLGLEEKLYSDSNEGFLDWRRRLTMRAFYCGSLNQDQKLISNVVHQYEKDVAAGVAPYPLPRYVTNGTHGKKGEETCLLYRILKLFIDDGRTEDHPPQSLSDIILPKGYTTSLHNTSFAFHLAAIISSIGCCRPLTPIEKANLVHGYAAQLLDAGMWEWASYVFLCLTEDASMEELQWRRAMAKGVVLQHFRLSDPSANRRRAFLENDVGFPSDWFHEALSDRCAYVGDVHGYVTQLSFFSASRARIAFENLMLPNLFMQTAEQGAKLLELFGKEEGTLAAAVFDLFRLSQEVLRLSGTTVEESKESATQLLDHATKVQAALEAYETNERVNRGGRGLRMRPNYRILPLAFFLSEAMSALSFVMLQLRALEAGVSVIDDNGEYEKSGVVKLKVASQLAFVSASDSVVLNQTGSLSDDIVMGLI